MKFTTHFELHSQTTRLFEDMPQGPRPPSHTRGSHPPWPPVPRKLGPGRIGQLPLQLTTLDGHPPDFKLELFPLHSPLLGESLLVSVPRLIDMLKFRRCPYL